MADQTTSGRMSHDEFLHALESCTLPGDSFRHRDHVRLAWLYLRRLSYEQAVQSIERSVRRYATHHGAPEKYHHTLTLLWMRLVAAAMTDGNEDFDALLEHHPSLLDKNTPRRFYSAERLDSPMARSQWLEPDLLPLPAASFGR